MQVAMSEDQIAESFLMEKNTDADESEVHPDDAATIRNQKVIQSPSFIQSLSDDLFFEIFLIFVSQANSAKALRSNPPAQFILSTICRRWRDIVICSPLLWTDIFFPTNPNYDTLISFERSCPAPINVSFDSVSCRLYDDGALPSFAQALIRHNSRLRSLSISVQRMTDMREFWGTLESLEALHLQALSIQLYQSTCDAIVGSTSHTPLWRGGGLVRSVRVVGLCFRCLPLLVGLTKLEIGHVELNSRDLQTLLNNHPSLSTLVIGRFGAPIHFGETLPDQSHPAQVLAPSLRSLAIYIDDSHSSECTCGLPWLVMDKLEYLEIMLPLYMFTTHHASILSRLKSVPLLRKLRIYGLVDHLLVFDKTFFSSLPKSIDLEFVYYPASTSPALSEILALPYLHSISFDLTSRHSSQLGRHLDLDDFVGAVPRTQLKSPLVVHLPITENTVKLDEIKAVHGDKLSIHTFPTQKGLLDDFLRPHFSVIDFISEDGDEPEDLEDEIEDELADELEYDFEDLEDGFEDESDGSEFQGGFYASDWDIYNSEELFAEGFD
ncbi:hypothetical protein BYT27DRAFT_7138055 [Phlegmacium glaucopus]|nr:hypothetical protein BYT27DRAFT_7138055 [Phlegmacium glaucopus]